MIGPHEGVPPDEPGWYGEPLSPSCWRASVWPASWLADIGPAPRPLLKTKQGVSLVLRKVLSSATPPVPSPNPLVYWDMTTRMPKTVSSALFLTRAAVPGSFVVTLMSY